MINEFKSLFEGKESCLTEITEKHSFIYEDEVQKKGIFVSDKEIYHIHLEKQKPNSIYFVQNDDCIMVEHKGGQCDYVIFDQEEIHFVEVKAAKIKNLSKHKKTLYKQLESTFKHYVDFLKLFENKNALVCFEAVNKRGYTKRKVPTSSNSEKRLHFKSKYDINLIEGNYILFN